MALSKVEQLQAVKDAVVNLTTSPLYTFRQQESNLPVIGEGSYDAKVMLVGEAPGRSEAKTGRPFCGVAGRLLDELLASINLPRKEVFITNIVKDRPPQNRDPLPEEIAAYGPFLDQQISIIRPLVIGTLGRYSTSYILDKFKLDNLGSIGELHGRVIEVVAPYGPIKIVPLYHPAAAIYNQKLKATLLTDIKILKTLFKK